MLVIGTAGHIDHGKSSIVRRLTGTDPDRLPEEKARGMTIDLGFAFYQTPADDTIAFVDVPGHERFVKNMVAGAGGVDAVMLVVAADDGWMPQSEEHFQIVRLLNVKHGLIVINKTDLAEPDWLELLQQDIGDRVRGSFLQDAPIFRVSSQTGDGFDELSAYLNKLPNEIESGRDSGKPRLYIDRSFIRPGIGGVVTGTLRGGKLATGQQVGIWPSMKTAKIRSLHANNRDVDTVVPGQRTAVSLTGVDKEYLVRGGVITGRADLTYFQRHPVLALSAELLDNAPVSLADRRRVLLIVGTTEIEGEVRLYDQKQLRPGEKGILFFRPDEPMYALVGDHYIMRLPTPMVTLGGGQIIDHLKHFPRRRRMDQMEYLTSRLPIQLDRLIVSELQKRLLAPKSSLLAEADFSKSAIKNAVEKLSQEKTVKSTGEYLYHRETFETAIEAFKKQVNGYLEDKPHLKGLPTEIIASVTGHSAEEAEIILSYLVNDGAMSRDGDKYNFVGRDMSLKGAIKTAHGQIMASLKKSPYAPPLLSALAAGGKNNREAIKYIIESGEAYKCGSDFLFLSNVWDEIVKYIREKLSVDSELTVADLRDRFGVSRKFAIPILEETDRQRLTRREGDIRVKGDRFES